jgi:hypothetical protein
MARLPNKTAAAMSRIGVAKRANGIYLSPFDTNSSVRSCGKKDLVMT